MSGRFEIRGIGVVNATPLTADDRLNEAEYRRHIRWMLDAGVRFIQPAAATGQGMQLDEAEWRRVLELTVAEAKGRALVTAYTGRAGTAETIRLTRMARDLGADCAYIIQPFFTLPNADGLYHHYKMVAEAVRDFPLVFYNNPDRAGVSIPIDVMDRLITEHPNLVGLKQSDLNAFADSAAAIRDRVTVWPKAEKEMLFGLVLGAPGILTFAANVIPRELVDTLEAFRRGDLDKARETYFRVLDLINVIHIEPVPAAITHMLNRMGWEFGLPRMPVRPLSAAAAARVDAVCGRLGLYPEKVIEPPLDADRRR